MPTGWRLVVERRAKAGPPRDHDYVGRVCMLLCGALVTAGQLVVPMFCGFAMQHCTTLRHGIQNEARAAAYQHGTQAAPANCVIAGTATADASTRTARPNKHWHLTVLYRTAPPPASHVYGTAVLL